MPSTGLACSTQTFKPKLAEVFSPAFSPLLPLALGCRSKSKPLVLYSAPVEWNKRSFMWAQVVLLRAQLQTLVLWIVKFSKQVSKKTDVFLTQHSRAVWHCDYYYACFWWSEFTVDLLSLMFLHWWGRKKLVKELWSSEGQAGPFPLQPYRDTYREVVPKEGGLGQGPKAAPQLSFQMVFMRTQS